ncbi:MAG: protein phosphatase 2C domain-containing protein [Cyanobacteriota bacterium]
MILSHTKTKPYLWATGAAATQLSTVDQLVQDRFRIVAPNIVQDTLPKELPPIPEDLPPVIFPYLELFPYRLHLPEVYGICQLGEEQLILLDNAPIDRHGNLYPSLEEAWTNATALRQVYWLWQIVELWTPLKHLGVASSLLVSENLRVEGWRVRLRELYSESTESEDIPIAKLAQLGEMWAGLTRTAKRAISSQLEAIATQLKNETATLFQISTDLNQLLLEQAAQQSLRLEVASGTDAGPRQQHNEDSHFPTLADLAPQDPPSDNPLTNHLMMICDGIGGHDGGEVASQLAISSIKLQMRGLLAEIAEDPEIMVSDLVEEQIAASIRVANNLICSRNDEQGRESRRRMATTLVMALQLPQQIQTEQNGRGNSHELYIAHVGDSRAYWLTPNYCHQLTVDHDVATREVRLARNLYSEALHRPDAGGLTQALGVKDSEALRPTVQRFIIDEDGLLLLCSDGLSDYGLLEQYWRDISPNVMKGKMTLEEGVQKLIELANDKNGHDNTTVVLGYFQVSPQYPVLVNLSDLPDFSNLVPIPPESERKEIPELVSPITTESEDAEAIPSASEEIPVEAEKESGTWMKAVGMVLLIVALLVSAVTAGLLVQQWFLSPTEETVSPES